MIAAVRVPFASGKAVGIDCHTSCAACGAVVPVNALVPILFCPGCGGSHVLSPPSIALLAKEVLSHAPALALDEGRRASVWTPDGSFDVTSTSTAFRCEACVGPLAIDPALAAAHAGGLPCPRCRVVRSVRLVPDDLRDALPGVSHLLGEDREQLAAGGVLAAASGGEAVTVRCPDCGGNLDADGTCRSIECRFCGATTLLPDDVWQRLHPVRKTTRFYLWVARGEAPAKRSVAFDWASCSDALTGPDGELYLAVSEPGNVYGVMCLGPELDMRWAQRRLPFFRPALALTSDGSIVVWEKDHHAALVFSCADGTRRGELGGVEPATAETHQLDFVGIDSFCADADGTFLAVFEERLLRFDRDGRGIETWKDEPKRPRGWKDWFSFLGSDAQTASATAKGRRATLWTASPDEPKDADDRRHWDAARSRYPNRASRVLGFSWMTFKLANVGSRPLAFGWDSHVGIHVDCTGHLHALGRGLRDTALARLDRDGRLVYAVELPLSAPVSNFDRVLRASTDGQGAAFVLGRRRSDSSFALLVRVSPDGREITTVLDDARRGGPLTEKDKHLAVAPDGSFAIVGDDGRLKTFGPDGRSSFMSDQARRDVR